MEINHQQAMLIMNKRSDTKQLDSMTKSNYMQAASYYTAKKQAFFQKIQGDMQNQGLTQEQLEQSIEEKLKETYNIISTIWNKLDSLIMDMVVHDENIKSSGTRGEKITNAISKIISNNNGLQEKLKTYNISKDELNIVKDIYKKIDLKTMLKKDDNEDNEYINSSFASILGQAFEPFVAQALNYFAEQCGKIGQKCVDSLIGGFTQTGNLTISDNTATKIGGKSISPDVAMNVSENNTTSADLTVKENIDIKRMIHNNKNLTNTDASIGQRLYELLNSSGSTRKQMFGFSLKRWKDGEQNKQYTSSSVMQAQLNQIFHTKETWNYKYAFARGQLELSKNAIALFGPINIGVFTTHGFTWMDDFIQNRRLFMNIYSYIKPDYGEILPYVDSGNIYIHEYNKEKQEKITYKKSGYDFDNLPYYKISFQSVIGKK